MLDIQFIRDNAELVQEKSKQKGYDVPISDLLKLDAERKSLQLQIEELRTRRNEHTEVIKQQGKPTTEQISQGSKFKEELAILEEKFSSVDTEWLRLLKMVPNMPLPQVPVGATEEDNVVSKTVGEIPTFSFAPKNHWEIAEKKGWIDKERGTKIAGSRFVYLKGDLVRLEFALWSFGLDVLGNQQILQEIIANNSLQVSDKPFEPVIPPAVAKKSVFEATGRLNKEEQTYKIEDEDLWLNASAEHTLSPMYLNEIIPESDLPLRYVGYTTAFRREAGTYGKDTEGIFRLHQFNKLEMESFCSPDASLAEHLFMVAIQEYLMQKLGLPYRVLEKCTADIGRPNAKGVDIDAWLPGQQNYRETHTADYITDYQARAMKTRLRRKDGSVELLHTNDATAFSQRPLIAIIENYQTAEGDVKVPDVLKPYMGGRELL